MDVDIILMHKETPAAAFTIDADAGRIISRIEVLDAAQLPLPVQFNLKNDFTAVDAMQRWVAYRSIPHSRSNFDEFLARYGVSTPSAAAYKSLGLNLSDQYWYKPADFEGGWQEVNLFEHDFLAQSFEQGEQAGGSLVSPDASSNGELPKYWCVQEGKRLLYKQGSGPLYQQPYNEVFASKLLDELGLSHVNYGLETVGGRGYSVCGTFIEGTTEYIPAWDILGAVKKNNENTYQHFLRCAESLEIDVSFERLDAMLLFDFVIANSDRHFGNFGFIRNADTLEFIGLAPIFDNGNSLWYDTADNEMTTRIQPFKPFRETHEKQLKLLKTAKLPSGRLTESFIRETAESVFADAKRISRERIENIIRNVSYNARVAEKYTLN